MVTSSQRLSLSVRERLLLHLLKYQKFENDFEVPEALTQSGISESTGVARPNVSRAMKILGTKDLILEKLAHIKGHRRQKKVYLLTMSGLSQAVELDGSLGQMKLKYRDGSGKVAEKPLDDISAAVPGNPSKLDIISSLDDDGVCDHNSLAGRDDPPAGSTSTMVDEKIKPEAAPKASDDFVYTVTPPVELRHFYGRKKELSDLAGWYTSKEPRVILIQGIPGIGKTTLALESVNRNRHRTNIMWYKLKEWDSLRSIMKYLADFLYKLGKSKLGSYLESTKNMEPGEAAHLISEELMGIPAILVLDDFQNAPDDITALLKAIVPLVKHQEDLKIVLLTRELVKFYDRRDVVLDKTVLEFPLEGLDEQSSRKLLNLPSISDDDFAKIFLRTGGHPLYLELLESTAELDENSDIYEFIHEEVFSKLSENEQRLLKMASVYRYPVLAEAFFDDPDISYGNIDTLTARSYLVRHGLNLYDTHDLIRTFFYGRLTKAERRKFHGLASGYYSNLLSVSDDDSETRTQLLESKLELQYHLLQSNKPAEALKYTLKFGRDLIESGRYELLAILDGYATGPLEPLARGRILAMKGEILTRLGETRAALSHLNRSQKDLKGAASGERALVMTLIGENHAASDNWKEAEKYHKSALSILKNKSEHLRTPGDHYAMARSYNNLGLATKKSGEPVAAVELYEKALEILELRKVGTVQDRTAILENLGLLLVSLDQLDQAREYFERALAELEAEKDYAGLAKLFAMLGDIYVELGDIHTATEFFEKGVTYWEHAEDLSSATQAFLKLGQVYTDRFRDAGASGGGGGSVSRQPSYWERLLNFFSTVQEEDYRKISRLYDRIGGLYMHRGHWHRSLEFHEKALGLFKKINDERGIAKAYNNLGVLYRTRQEVVKALESYKKSLGYLESVGEVQGLAITHLNIGRLYERLNKSDQSRNSYNACIAITRKNDDMKRYRGMALLGLARQSGAGTQARAQYLNEAREIFRDVGDASGLEDADKLAAGK